MTSSRRVLQLQGPRPQPLKVGRDSWNIKKPKPAAGAVGRPPPVIFYVDTPKIFHTDPQDFKNLVLQLTGKPRATGSDTTICTDAGKIIPTGELYGTQDVSDPLLLTLGSSSPMAPVASPVSPGFFLFSPNTGAYLHEFSLSS